MLNLFRRLSKVHVQRPGRSSFSLSVRSRRRFLALAFSGFAAVSGISVLWTDSLSGAQASTAIAQVGKVRIGFQKSGTVLVSLKAKQTLENLFKARGSSVEWSEFTAGLPMVEALNAGAIDVGYVGEAPPVFAQAANGSTVRYVAYDPLGPGAEGILVHKDSKIKTLADLKGKKIGVQKGSNTHYLTVKALQAGKLKLSDVTISFLKPSDGRAAFERRDIDAWVVWDPFLAAAQSTANGRLLANAKGLAPNLGYYLSTESFTKSQSASLKLILNEIKKEAALIAKNPEGTAKFLSPILGVAQEDLLIAEKRRSHGALPITPAIIDKQQDVADTFTSLDLIPKSIKVKEAVWIWK